jgi:hypothetical protein
VPNEVASPGLWRPNRLPSTEYRSTHSCNIIQWKLSYQSHTKLKDTKWQLFEPQTLHFAPCITKWHVYAQQIRRFAPCITKKACARTLNSESQTHNEPSLAGDQASPARSSVSTANSCGGANHRGLLRPDVHSWLTGKKSKTIGRTTNLVEEQATYRNHRPIAARQYAHRVLPIAPQSHRHVLTVRRKPNRCEAKDGIELTPPFIIMKDTFLIRLVRGKS